jgi:hypothetical protein
LTDPPFGRRERISLPHADIITRVGNTVNNEPLDVIINDTLGDPRAAVLLLFRIGLQRLSPGRRLVFWLATDSSVSTERVVRYLIALRKELLGDGEEAERQLQLLRVTPEELRRGMWRWLCVFQRG